MRYFTSSLILLFAVIFTMAEAVPLSAQPPRRPARKKRKVKRYYDIKISVKPETLVWDGEKPLRLKVTLKNVGNVDARLDMRCRGAFSMSLQSVEKFFGTIEINRGEPIETTKEAYYEGRLSPPNERCWERADKDFDLFKIGQPISYQVASQTLNNYSDFKYQGERLTWENRPDGEYILEVRYGVGPKTPTSPDGLEGTITSAYTKIRLKRKAMSQ